MVWFVVVVGRGVVWCGVVNMVLFGGVVRCSVVWFGGGMLCGLVWCGVVVGFGVL